MSDKTLQKFADDQLSRVQDIIETIRTHHGDDIAEAMTVMTGVIITMEQHKVLMLSLIANIPESNRAWPEIMKGLAYVTDDGMEMIRTVYGHLLPDDEAIDAMAPFMEQIYNASVAVSRKVVSERLGVGPL